MLEIYRNEKKIEKTAGIFRKLHMNGWREAKRNWGPPEKNEMFLLMAAWWDDWSLAQSPFKSFWIANFYWLVTITTRLALYHL